MTFVYLPTCQLREVFWEHREPTTTIDIFENYITGMSALVEEKFWQRSWLFDKTIFQGRLINLRKYNLPLLLYADLSELTWTCYAE